MKVEEIYKKTTIRIDRVISINGKPILFQIIKDS